MDIDILQLFSLYLTSARDYFPPDREYFTSCFKRERIPYWSKVDLTNETRKFNQRIENCLGLLCQIRVSSQPNLKILFFVLL